MRGIHATPRCQPTPLVRIAGSGDAPMPGLKVIWPTQAPTPSFAPSLWPWADHRRGDPIPQRLVSNIGR
jgi:hypothetical protein